MENAPPTHPTPPLGSSRPNRLKRVLESGQIGLGCLLSYDAPWLVEVLGLSGYDFVTIDIEHEPMDPSAVSSLVRTADLVGMTSIIRMPMSPAVFPYLSTGAQGIQVPDLRGRAHAEEVVEFTRFPPRGRRTYYTQTRAAQYGIGIDEEAWLGEADNELFVVAMLEDIALMDELDEILAIDGIDAFHIGTLDLAQSMGTPPPDKIDEVVSEMVTRCRAAGKYTSVGVITPWAIDGVKKRIEQGVQFFNVASAWMLTDAVASFLDQVESRVPDELRQRTARLPTPNKYVNPKK